MYSGEHGCQAESDSRNCRICSAGWETGETVVLWRKDLSRFCNRCHHWWHGPVLRWLSSCSSQKSSYLRYYPLFHQHHLHNPLQVPPVRSIVPGPRQTPFYPSRTWQYLNVFPSEFTSKLESISVWPNPFGPHLIRSFVGFHGSFVQLVQTESMLN